MWLAGAGLGVSERAGAVSPEYRVYRFGPEVVPRFIHHLVRSRPYLDQYRLLVRAETTFDRRVTKEDFRELPLVLPPTSVQQAIADYLDTETTRIDALIEKKRRMVELLEAGFQASRWNQLSKGLDGFAGVAERLSATAGWHRTRLKYLVGRPVAGAWGSEPGVDEVDVACYRVADFDRWLGTVPSTAPTIRSVPRLVRQKLALSENDLLLEKSGGGDKHPVGCVARFSGSDASAVCSNFIARLRPESEYDPRFLAHVFAALYQHKMTQPFVKQTTGIQNLDMDGFLSRAWAIPNVDEQVAIRERIEQAQARSNSLINKVRCQIDLLVEHRQALITAAVTGQLDIPGVAA
jgi:type I restriction enzyme S subunit